MRCNRYLFEVFYNFTRCDEGSFLLVTFNRAPRSSLRNHIVVSLSIIVTWPLINSFYSSYIVLSVLIRVILTNAATKASFSQSHLKVIARPSYVTRNLNYCRFIRWEGIPGLESFAWNYVRDLVIVSFRSSDERERRKNNFTVIGYS